MDMLSVTDLKNLAAQQEGPCVTLYMPTHVAGADGQQDPVRLKNLLQRAEEELSEHWMRGAEARKLLASARDLPTDPVFWEKRSDGLAIFLSPQAFHRFRVPVKLDEVAIVNQRFHLKPLLPLLSGNESVFVLALSQNKVRLMKATRHRIAPVEVAGLPENMKQALNYDGADRGTQVHSAMRGSLGKQAAVFHGQGGQPDAAKDDLTQYFRIIDAALRPLLREARAPLLLAGVDYLLPLYREVNSYPHLNGKELPGNCDYLSDHELHTRVRPLMESLFDTAREVAVARYRESIGAGKTSDELRKIVPAAHQGQVDVLFVDRSVQQWGRYDPQNNTVELDEQPTVENDDLLDLAAVQTLLHRGTVYAVEPEQSPSPPIAALYRY